MTFRSTVPTQVYLAFAVFVSVPIALPLVASCGRYAVLRSAACPADEGSFLLHYDFSCLL